MPQFRSGRTHEFATHRRIEKELLDLDRRPQRTATFTRRVDHSTVDFQLHAGVIVGLPAAQAKIADFGDGSEGFAAKSHRLNSKQVIGFTEFAGRVGCYGQQQIIGVNSFSVITDPDQFGATVNDIDLDPIGESIDAVFEKFLDHTGRSFDDFAGGNAIDNTGTELVDAGHAMVAICQQKFGRLSNFGTESKSSEAGGVALSWHNSDPIPIERQTRPPTSLAYRSQRRTIYGRR